VIIVVSPLNALIKDQLRRLKEGSVKSTVLSVKAENEDLELDSSDANPAELRDAKYIPIYVVKHKYKCFAFFHKLYGIIKEMIPNFILNLVLHGFFQAEPIFVKPVYKLKLNEKISIMLFKLLNQCT